MKQIPHIQTNIHTHLIGASRVLYNPLCKKGVTVIKGPALKVYNLIDGKRTVGAIYKYLTTKQKEIDITKSDVVNIFSILIEYQIVYFDHLPKLDIAALTTKGSVFAVWFHITNQCNLRCKYCFVWKTAAEMSKEVGERAIKNLILSSQKAGFKHIRFNYAGGEPLLKIELVKHFTLFAEEFAKKNNMSVQFGVVTNGVLITEEIASFLSEHKAIITITLDGVQKDHDLQRPFKNGIGSYSYVKKGIEILKKYKVSFAVNIIVAKNNIKGLPSHIKELVEEGTPFRTIFIKENPFAENGLRVKDEELITTFKKIYKNIKKNIPSYKIVNGLLDYVILRPMLFKCRAGRENIAVDWKGIVSPCAMLMDRHTGTTKHKNVIQKLKDPGLASVNEINECKTCKWKYICGGGCASETYNAYGKFAVKTPYCDVYKALIPDIIDLEARRIMKYDR